MDPWPSSVRTWGSTPAEREQPYPCDRYLPDGDELHRAVDVDAPAATTFRWLCQLRVAPYSYDLLDNFGKKSPGELAFEPDHLELGQHFMTIFKLADFEPGRSITLLHSGRAFGRVAVTYLAEPLAVDRSRIVVKLRIAYPRSPIGAIGRLALPLGDLVMMRRQLLNLKALAEESS